MVLEGDVVGGGSSGSTLPPLDHFQVFVPRADGYREQDSIQVAVMFSEWRKITLDLPPFSLSIPIRIDPATQPCIIELAALRILNPSGDVLWRLSDSTAGNMQIAGDAVAISRGAIMKILSDGTDPQIHLPPLAHEGAESSVRFEASVRLDASPLSLAKCLGEYLRSAL